MLIRTISASLAVVFAVSFAADAAMADHRKKKRIARSYDHYYAGPEVVRGVPGLRLLFGDYAMTREEYDALYGEDDADDFDAAYYEPRALTPEKPRTAPAAKKASVPAEKTQTTKAATAKTASVAKASTTQNQTASSGSLSCDKAGSIVSGYGFESVKPQTCKGKTYAFAATRDGKSFAIKLDSASGELTEVKKLQ